MKTSEAMDSHTAKHTPPTGTALMAAKVILFPYLVLVRQGQLEAAAAVIDEAFPAYAEVLEALNKVANIEGGRMPDRATWKDLAGECVDIARAAIAKVKGAAPTCNSESPEPSTYCTFALGHKGPCSWEIDEAVTHLRAALGQTVPSDDQIIVGHVRDALKLLEGKCQTA